jgi:hypothetical protein
MTTTVRSVRVEMDLEVSRYVSKARLVGRETDSMADRIERRLITVNRGLAGMDANLKSVGRAEDAVSSSTTRMNTRLGDSERSLKRTTGQLDTFTGRAGVLLKLAAGFGPALLPIGAIGIPALAGLAAQGGFAAGALGASVLALRGVGDGIKALEKARLDPTVENMNEAQQLLNRMGPDVASLVLHLDDLTEVRDKLQNSAAAGFIPGLNEALDELEAGVPLARRLLREFGDISGDILAEGAGSLTSSRWTRFFNYLRTDARPILDATADGVGNVAHGLAMMFVGTSSDQIDFSNWLRETTESFDDWATRLDSNTDFQDFLAYARENGPQVADTLGSIAAAFAAVIEAAAPLGGPTLQILETLADVIDAIASSPLGTPIFTAIQGYSLLSTVLPGVKKGYEGISVAQTKVEGRMAAGRSTLTTFAGDLRNVARYGSLATESSKRLRTQLGPLIKGGAGLAGLAVATSGVADGIGLSHTASMALIGTLAGPWGAAVGGAAGFALDLKDANSKATDSIRELRDAAHDSPTDFRALEDGIDRLRQKASEYRDDIDSDNFGEFLANSFDPDVIVGFTRDAFGLSSLDQQMDDAAADVEHNSERIKDAIASISYGLGDSSTFDQLLPFGHADLDALTSAADRLQPALSTLGISFDDLAHMDASQLADVTGQVEAFFEHSDSYAGRAEAVSAAIDDLDDGLTTTAESAERLRNSLDALLGPQLGLSAATDAWTTALRHLNDDLSKNGRSLKGNSDAAIENRAAIRDRVNSLTDVLVAEAQAGASADKLRGSLRQQRAALIEAGEAAGISKRDMQDYLNTLGLTPRLVKTLIENNSSEARHKAEGYFAWLRSHDGDTINTYVRVNRIGGGSVTSSAGGHSVPVDGEGADGLTLPKSGKPYADRYLIWAADGEEVISNRHGQADRFRSDRAAGRIPRYADGGPVRRSSSTGEDKPDPHDPHNKRLHHSFATVAAAALSASHSLRELKQESNALQRTEEKLRKRRDTLQSRYDDISQRTSSMFLSDIFAESQSSGSPWAAGAKPGGTVDPLGVLQGDITNVTRYQELLDQLKRRGLDQEALDAASAGGVRGLEVIANYSDAQLGQFESLIGIRSHLATQAGTTTAESIVGPELRAQTKELQGIRAELRDVKGAIEVENEKNRNNADKNAHGHGDGQGSAGRGRQGVGPR